MDDVQLRNAEKRGPTTPLALSKLQNKRKLHTKLTDGTSPQLITLGSSAAKEYQAELLDAKYQHWLANSELQRQKEMTHFLELERKFMAED